MSCFLADCFEHSFLHLAQCTLACAAILLAFKLFQLHCGLFDPGHKRGQVFLKYENALVVKARAGFLATGHPEIQPVAASGNVKEIRPRLSGEFQGLEVFGHVFFAARYRSQLEGGYGFAVRFVNGPSVLTAIDPFFTPYVR